MKKTIVYIVSILVSALFLTGCDRSGVFEEIDQKTPYEFHVISVADNNNVVPISGTTVELYSGKGVRDSLKSRMLDKTTDASGKVIFMPEELTPGKGFYYMALERNDYSSMADSRYLMINDGHTQQWVRLKKTTLSVQPTQSKYDGSSGTITATGATVYAYMNKADRDVRNTAAVVNTFTKSLTSGQFVMYHRPDMDASNVYRKFIYLSVEKVDTDNRTMLARVNPAILFDSINYPVLLQKFDLNVTVKRKLPNIEEAVLDSGVNVTLYKTAADREAEANAVATKITQKPGIVTFTDTGDGLLENREYFLKATKIIINTDATRDTCISNVNTGQLTWKVNSFTTEIKKKQ